LEVLSEEEIIIEESSSSGTESSQDFPQGRLQHCRTDAPTAVQQDMASNLLYSVPQQAKVPSTADTQHFFERGEGGSVCKVCK
ncbi:hypothetical protein PISMIDRAFT_113359, partial [Pisolithus microcarpus 441]